MSDESTTPGRSQNLEIYLRESLRPTKILLVEDDIDTCEQMKRCTSEFNISWEIVNNPDDARALFGFWYYDLILLDLRLGAGRSGAELLQEVEHDETRNVIIFTRYPDSPEALEAIRNGALVLVIKPDAITREWAGRFLRTFGVPRKPKQKETS